MKPLTIEQLKELEVGDWVWTCNKRSNLEEYEEYRKITDKKVTCITLGNGTNKTTFDYFEYGSSWLAYKNKEQAEAKGEIVELPCKIETLHVGDTVYYIQEYFNASTLQHESHVKRTTIDYIAKDYIEVNNGVGLSVDKFWLVQEEAERRLVKLKGE